MSRGLVDLHRHLDGSLRPSTVHSLAAELGLEVPADLAFTVGMGLDAALSRFAFTLSLLQQTEAVARVASEICEDAADDGVTTLELRFAPQLHCDRGATMPEIIDAAIEGANGRAGLILCGLYGEAPSLLAELVELARHRPQVVGLDLAGGPHASQSFRLLDYRDVFRTAKAAGLGRTVHAGEGRPPSEIRVAIEELGATRIGHGTTLLDDPKVVDLVIERQVTIEACLTSNLHTGAIPSIAEHPLPRWLERGVRACINTDNTLLSSTSSSHELELASTLPGMSDARIEQALRDGHSARFTR